MYKTTVRIDGMMCEHCEAHVNDAIRNAFDVKKVSSSHKKGETTIVAQEPLAEDAIKEALAPTGYAVLGVESAEAEDKGFGIFGGGAR